VVSCVLVGMLFLAGARVAQLGSLAAFAVVVLPLLPHLLHGYQRRRLEIFLNPGSDPLGAGYNLLQARIAVGAGGPFRAGLAPWPAGSALASSPSAPTDFVFAVYAEQFGLLGSVPAAGVVRSAADQASAHGCRAPDRFGALVAGGVLS